MDLSPEDRARIEAEERYRHEFREKLSARGTKPSAALWWIAIIVASLVMVVVAIRELVDQSTASERTGSSYSALVPKRAPSFTFVDAAQPVTQGQIIVRSGQLVYFRFPVSSDMFDARLVGRFSASGGSGNDIEAALFASEDEYQNWSNGHTASAVWSSGGKRTTGSCSVGLREGNYVLAFSNKYSLITDKQVFTAFEIRYRRKVAAE